MIPSVFIGEPQFGNESPIGLSDKDLVNGLVPETGLMTIVGEPGAGKTFLALHLAACIAIASRVVHSDDSTFGLPLKKGACIYITAEGYNYLQNRIISLEKYYSDMLALSNLESLPIIKLPVHGLSGIDHILPIQSKIADKILELKSRGFPPSVIIFDTLSSTWLIRDENNNSEIQRIVSCLREYGRRFNCLVICISHPPKSFMAKKGSVRGAGSIEGASDVIWSLSKVGKSSRRKLIVTKQRDGRCVNNKYDFDLMPYGDSAVLLPICAEEKSGDDKESNLKRSKPLITDNEKDVLLALEAANHLGNGLEKNSCKKTVLDTMCELCDIEMIPQDRMACRDTVRKRIDRCLDSLEIKKIILKKPSVDADKDFYIPFVPWTEMSQYIRSKCHISNYVGFSERRYKETINGFSPLTSCLNKVSG